MDLKIRKVVSGYKMSKKLMLDFICLDCDSTFLWLDSPTCVVCGSDNITPLPEDLNEDGFFEGDMLSRKPDNV